MSQSLLSLRSPRVSFSAASLLAAVFSAGAASGQVTVGSLADELADRDTLTVFPSDMPYTQEQASSHDTRNGTVNGSRLGGAWGFRNVDFGNFIRQETNSGRTELVVFEDSGPGAIIRWWSTGVNQGVLDNNNFRIYIDGSSTPAITSTGTNWLSGNNSGFGPQLNFFTPERGGNTYGIIPYNTGIKVTWDGPTTHFGATDIGSYVAGGGTQHTFANALWYNINYRKYAPGTTVESYTGSSTNTYSAQLSNVNAELGANVVQGNISATDTVSGQSIAAGDDLARTFTAPAAITDGQAIREITFKVNGGSSTQQRDALAGVFIEFTFDGQLTGRIPVGQFFGNGWSQSASNVYNVGDDYYRTVASDGTMTTRWVMPYQNNAQVRLVNESGSTVNVDLEIKTGSYDWTNDSMHFHADYRQDLGILTRDVGGSDFIPDNQRYSSEGDADFRFIDIRGKGVYVGDTMSIRNRNIGGSTATDRWWGEGDEKIYVDYLDGSGNGSTSVPDHLGTGAEDYYGYSFGSGRIFGTDTNFDNPFIIQPIASAQRDTGGTGLTIQGRVRGLDAIPFEQSLKFDMEVWKWMQGSVDHGAATFWYGTPGSASLYVAAELSNDFKRHAAGVSNGSAATSIPDTAGDGSWTFFNADAEINSTNTQTLTWGTVGNQGTQGFGGGENDENGNNLNLGAISDQFIFGDGTDNIDMQGGPGYRELTLHPAGDGTFGNTGIQRDFLVTRWVAGASSAGLININGSIRNLVDFSGLGSNSIEFFIFVNGVQRFNVEGTSDTLEEAYFDFDATIEAGQTVDFVVSAKGNGIADESVLRATILAQNATANSVVESVVPSSLTASYLAYKDSAFDAAPPVPEPADPIIRSVGASQAGSASTYTGSVSNSDLVNAGAASLAGVTVTTSGIDNDDFFNRPGHANDGVGHGGSGATDNGVYHPVTFDPNGTLPATYTFELDTSTNTNGYDIDSVVTFAGWHQFNIAQSIANQRYQLWVSEVGSAGFTQLGTFSVTDFQANAGNGAASSRLTVDTSNGVPLARNVDAVRFVLQDHGIVSGTADGTIYHEFDVFGQPSVPPAPPAPVPGTVEIAPDKQPMSNGETAGFANYSSYTRGINRLVVDIQDLPGNGAFISASDFIFRVGNDNTPDSWGDAPAPMSFTVRPGGGDGGSDRIVIDWANNVIQNEWLQVTVIANDNTALPPDGMLDSGVANTAAGAQFYYGNATYDAGLPANQAAAEVTFTDAINAFLNQTLAGEAAITNAYDYNRDGIVNFTDAINAFLNQTTPSTAVQLISPLGPGAWLPGHEGLIRVAQQ